MSTTATERYAGADWIKHSLRRTLSPLGEKAADTLGFVFQGIYHLDQNALGRVDWSSDICISFNLHWQSMATFDDSLLTRLVVAAHDRCIRVDIEARAPRCLGLMFHARQGREGQMHARHPTIEQAVAACRADGSDGLTD